MSDDDDEGNEFVGASGRREGVAVLRAENARLQAALKHAADKLAGAGKGFEPAAAAARAAIKGDWSAWRKLTGRET